ncbi:hypothetical protein [Halospeciosus flavus]|uniref:hypothetical protein n=1 Tax=Halospeciosus flavus TaxID=3032283 RepID=UPI0036D3E857
MGAPRVGTSAESVDAGLGLDVHGAVDHGGEFRAVPDGVTPADSPSARSRQTTVSPIE